LIRVSVVSWFEQNDIAPDTLERLRACSLAGEIAREARSAS
jgi:hypothetical protein